jgi:predicted transglutaminase-like cysteine proteinase
LFCDTYPSFTENELKLIENKSGKITKNRIIDYQKNIDLLQQFKHSEQITKVNLYLNQLLPQYDDVIQKQNDYWATPKEFLYIGYGDCEDYAIIKYFTLLKLGFDKDKLFIAIVYEKYSGNHHMVLSYFENKNVSPLILDNLSFLILDLQKREDLRAVKFINSDGVFKLNSKNELIKTQESSKKFLELLRRVQKESL